MSTKGKPQPRHSVASMKKIMKEVSENYSTGLYTIESCCEKAGVGYNTYLSWLKAYEKNGMDENSKLYPKWSQLKEVVALVRKASESAEDYRDKELVKIAESSLKKRVEGFTFDETTTEVKQQGSGDNATMVPVGMKKTTKYYPPSDLAIQFVLKNRRRDKYGDKMVVTNVNINTEQYSDKSIEEIREELAKTEKELSVTMGLTEYADPTYDDEQQPATDAAAETK